MSIGTTGNHGNNCLHSQLGTLLNGPFHAVEFEDSEQQCEVADRNCRRFLAELKFDAILRQAGDSAMAGDGTGNNVELLPDSRAEDAHEMASMVSYERGMISG